MSVIIDKAIEVLGRDGWCRGSYTDSMGRHCLVGAMQTAQRESGIDNAVYWRAREAIVGCIFDAVDGAFLSEMDVDTINWNDEYAAGVEQVLEVLRCASERADAREAALQEAQS